MIDRAALSRYLRQVEELGGSELFLDSMARTDATKLAAGRHRLVVGADREAGIDALRRAVSGPSGRAEHGEDPASVIGDADRPESGVRALVASREVDPARLERLEELGSVAAQCTLCRLHEGRTKVVFGEGSPAADLVVVGEAPGQEEDRTGRPFVGRAGRLLDLMLMAAGFPREQVYICNVLKCRPPGNRNPQTDEMDVCTRNYLHGQLELIAPRVLLAVGRFAVQALLDSTTAIGRLRGRVHAYRGIPLVVSYHPAYLLRSPNMIRTAWSDYQLIRTVVDEPV